MEVKRRFSRMDLIQTAPPGPQEWACALCNGLGYRLSDIEHAEDCPLADMSVTSIIVVKTRAAVVFRLHLYRWWWRSVSGKLYHIEKLPGRYAMHDQAGNEITAQRRLRDVRGWITRNQGVL